MEMLLHHFRDPFFFARMKKLLRTNMHHPPHGGNFNIKSIILVVIAVAHRKLSCAGFAIIYYVVSPSQPPFEICVLDDEDGKSKREEEKK